MKTISTLFLLSSLTFGCASTQLGGSPSVAFPQRGAVLVKETSVKAIVAGPVDIHAYSAFAGGTFFVADAVTGTDRDCELAAHAGPGSALPADRVQSMTVAAGKMACVATSARRSIEVLWHMRKSASGPPLLARNQ